MVSGSACDTWLETTTQPPARGTFSCPAHSCRLTARSAGRSTALATVYVAPGDVTPGFVAPEPFAPGTRGVLTGSVSSDDTALSRTATCPDVPPPQPASRTLRRMWHVVVPLKGWQAAKSRIALPDAERVTPRPGDGRRHPDRRARLRGGVARDGAGGRSGSRGVIRPGIRRRRRGAAGRRLRRSTPLLRWFADLAGRPTVAARRRRRRPPGRACSLARRGPRGGARSGRRRPPNGDGGRSGGIGNDSPHGHHR